MPHWAIRAAGKLVAAAAMIIGAFLVVWFFLAIAFLALEPRRRGVVEVGLAVLFLAAGVGALTLGYRRYPR
jgi:hypothetical protein